MRAKSEQVLAIDLVRFLCALLVVAHHFGAMLPLAPPPFARATGVPATAAPWAWAGWVGVEIFFVVSGYVIAMSAGKGRPGAFLRRRALRLAPAAWIAASLTTLAALVAGIAPAGELLARWCGSMAFAPWADQADPSYWTLGIELSFYLLVAALIAGPWRGRVLEPLGLALALASFGFWAARGGWAAPESHDRLTDLSLLPHGAFFAVGIALRGLALRGSSALRLATVVIGLVAGTWEIAAQARFMAHGLRLEAGPGLPLALFALGVAAVASAGQTQAWLAANVGARWLGFLGAVTYPLYLVHQRMGMIAIAALAAAGVGGGIAVLAVTVGALMLAGLIAARLEPALRRWLAARFDALAIPVAAPAPVTS